ICKRKCFLIRFFPIHFIVLPSSSFVVIYVRHVVITLLLIIIYVGHVVIILLLIIIHVGHVVITLLLIIIYVRHVGV
ncbi:hypothetical protein ACQUY5_33070, partial [Bacillus cereus]|uniref:hypothetical protein n=1 Tax=Bacillus cereus TaxID=1396 RepID=UPI003D1809AF